MKNFMNRLSKRDLQAFVEGLCEEYNFKDKAYFKNFKHLRNEIYLISFALGKENVQLMCSDENMKIRNFDKFSNAFGTNAHALEEKLKLEWQAFLIAKFETEYIIAKMIFKPSQTKVFRHVGKYDKLMTQREDEQKPLDF